MQLIKKVDERIPEKIFADSKRIKQILMNLLSNALKFTVKGSISITFGWEDDPAIKQGEAKDSVVLAQNSADKIIQKKLFIDVSDTGFGMKKSDLGKLFKSFGKLKDDQQINKKGCGLGLNISRRIVVSMNGSITVES